MTDSTRKAHLTLMDAALDLQQVGEHEAAVSLLKRAQEMAPDYAPIYLLLGINYEELNQPEKAEVSLRKTLTLEPEYPEALQALGLLLLEQDRWAEAVILLKKHLVQEPADLASLQALGTALLRMERPEEAVPVFRQAWLQAGDEKTGLAVGRILISMRCFEEAEKLLRDIADQFETPEVLNDWSAVLAVLGRCRDSIPILKRTLEVDAACDRAWRGLAYCYHEMGELEGALDASERALALNADHYRNWQIHAEILLHLGKYRQALNAAWHGIELIDPSDEEAQWFLSRLLALESLSMAEIAETSSTEDFVKVLEEGHGRFPTRQLFPAWMAVFLNQMGRSEEALAVLDEFAHDGQLDGRLGLLRYETLHLLGRAGEARDFIEPLLATDTENLLEELSILSAMLYERGEIEAVDSIDRQLLAFFPDKAGFAWSLGLNLVGQGKYIEAEKHLTSALESLESGRGRAMVQASLGYLYLVQGDCGRADRYLREALVFPEETPSHFRVAYWHEDRVVPDFVPHPTRALLLPRAVSANQVTLALARGNIEEAETLARQMLQDDPDDPWGHTMLGWVLRTQRDWEEARQSWQQALELTRNTQDREAITGWLESLANDS